jgi:hypothetical protein
VGNAGNVGKAENAAMAEKRGKAEKCGKTGKTGNFVGNLGNAARTGKTGNFVVNFDKHWKEGKERSAVTWSEETPRECDEVATKGTAGATGNDERGESSGLPFRGPGTNL